MENGEFCCVAGCIYSRRIDPNIGLHEFPKDPDYAAKWIRSINMYIPDGGTWFPKDGSKLCDRHFLKSDFRTDLKKPTLKPKTVPSVFENELPLYSRLPTRGKKRQITQEVKSPLIVKVIKPSDDLDLDDTPLTELLRDSSSVNHTPVSTNGTANLADKSFPITNSSQYSNGNVLQTPQIVSTYTTYNHNVITTSNIEPVCPTPNSQPISSIPSSANNVSLSYSQNDKNISSMPTEVASSSPNLIEIGPGTFLKINPDVLKVTKKVSSAGDTVMQFTMNAGQGNDDGSIIQQVIADVSTTNSKLSNNFPVTESNSLIRNVTNGSNVPILISGSSSIAQPLPIFRDPKQVMTLRQKNKQIHTLKAKLDNLIKKVEELETKCVVQERQLDLPSLKKLRVIKKNAEKGESHANFILEQIRGYSGNPQMRWSTSTMNQCAVWCRKAPYAYEYFKKADLFRLPCIGTVKRYIKKHPEITQQIKDRTISAHVVDSGDSSSDFEFDDEEENEMSQDHFQTNNGEEVPCETILTDNSNEVSEAVCTIIPDHLTSEESSSQLEVMTDHPQPETISTEGANDCESNTLNNETEPETVQQLDGSNASDLTSQEIVVANLNADSNGVYVPTPQEGQITTLNLNGQEIILQPGNIIQLNSGVEGVNGMENQYFVIPSADDQSAAGNDHEYSIAQPVSFVLESGDNDEQVIYITEETAKAMEAAIRLNEENA